MIRRALLLTATGAALIGSALFGPSKPAATALPTFAQAYHVDCKVCHTAIPQLNAYGRYIQRTGFAALDPNVMKTVLPLLVRESVNARSTGKLDANAPNDKVTEANLNVNAVGFMGSDVTYRAEQTLYSNNLSGGGLGRIWFGYHDLFKRNGHLFVGKLEPAVEPAYSNWGDMTGFASSSVAAGRHTYGMGSARWGSAFTYVHGVVDAEISWSALGSNLVNGADFSTLPGGDKAAHYKLAYATPDKPFEIGVYGTSGGYVLPTSAIDRYAANGIYAQRDPTGHIPGLIAFYQSTVDSNIGTGAKGRIVPAAGHQYATEVQIPAWNGNVVIGIRPVEFVNNGAGTLRHYGNVDLYWHDPRIPYLYATAESAFNASSNAPNGRPVWRFSLKWASPIRPPFKETR